MSDDSRVPGGEKRRPTIREVAKLAGVSHQTVSRYFREMGSVREIIRDRIRAAVNELGYRPNFVARAMRDRHSRRLALLLPPGTAWSSLEVLSGATEAAREAGYVVELVTLGGPVEGRGGRAMELSDSGLYEGVACLMEFHLDPCILESARSPIVVAPYYDDHMRSVGSLADASPMAEIIAILAGKGHRTFLHLSGSYEHASSRERRDAYLENVARLRLESYGVINCEWSPVLAREAVRNLPADCGVTAIIGANDLVAVGAMSGAWVRGWKVPGGCDGHGMGQRLHRSSHDALVDVRQCGPRATGTARGSPDARRHESTARARRTPSCGHSHLERFDGSGTRVHELPTKR